MPKVERRVRVCFPPPTLCQTAMPVNTKAPINIVTTKNRGNSCTPQSMWSNKFYEVSLQAPFSQSTECFLASSLGMWGRVQPHEAGSGGNVNVFFLNGDEVSAFLNGCPVGVGRELWQAGLLHSGIVGEDGVLARGACGAAGVRVVGGILVQRHRQLQILLSATRGKRQTNIVVHITSKTDISLHHRMVRRGGLTWLDVMARQRSKSSNSCLNVGLWEGTACQQSLIIIYLQRSRDVKIGATVGQWLAGPSFNPRPSRCVFEQDT